MTGHKDKDLIMAFAVEAQTSETPWDIFESRDRGVSVWLICTGEPEWDCEYTTYRLKPQTQVIDWAEVNYDIVPVKHSNARQPFYAAQGTTHVKGETLVTGKKIAWQGGECPLPEGVEVDLELRNGARINIEATKMDWDDGSSSEIIWFEVTGYADGFTGGVE